MDLNRRLFLQGIILSLPTAKLLSSVGGAFGAHPVGKRLGWRDLELYYPSFAEEQMKLFKENGEQLAENLKPWWNERCTCFLLDPNSEENCMRHSAYYYNHFGKSDDDESTRKFNFDNVITPWPANLNLSNGTEVMDAYARVVHNVDGLENWLIDNTAWTIFQKPVVLSGAHGGKLIYGIHSWNEPGEPGGCNPGPTFHFLVDGQWKFEDANDMNNTRRLLNPYDYI